ncbi:ribonuclease hi large subunit [Grosmannia clavigera kw1407]|uniref:Ribonuclease n=1 Tax=Grosmannia clavigera (strain kw1407 / UAMH 11150) TaxID=655863 RepID=F0XD26_GROCL|nr:ribonuclease hi large subunit [Grosmannia clavigera kw1407]EFX03830.1 ribonuclease hi large subunit [Grosmannia clavigera kw1407]
MDDDTHMEEAGVPVDTAVAASTEFLPPSIDEAALLAGDSYSYFSPVLSADTRASLMAALCRPGSSLHRSCGWATAALSARDIGADMLAPASAAGSNLNAQAADATVALIRGVLARGVRVTDVYVDTVGPPATYQKKLERVFPGLRITVAKKADSLYPCVSAASVCAKVTRDVALAVLYRRYGAASASEPDWGSGYPSDGRCTAWLRRNIHPVFGWGPECRFSWGTAKDLLEDDSSAKKKSTSTSAKQASVRVEWPLPDDDDPSIGRMTGFLVSSTTKPSQSHIPADDVDELGSWFGRPVGLEAF